MPGGGNGANYQEGENGAKGANILTGWYCPFATYRYKSAPEWAIYRLKPISKTESKDSVCDMGGGGQRFQLLLVSESKNLSQTFDYLLAWSLMLYLAWICLKNSATAWLRPKCTLKTFKFVQKKFFLVFLYLNKISWGFWILGIC